MLRTLIPLVCLAPALAANQIFIDPSCTKQITFAPPTGTCAVAIQADEDLVWLRNHYTVRFDVASQIPAGSTITHAELVVVAFGFDADPSSYEIRELLAPVCPGGTWTGSAYGLGAPAGPILFSDYQSATFTSPAFTAVVDNWFQQPAQAFGVMFAVPMPFLPAGEMFSETCVSSAKLRVDFDPPCPAPVSYCVAAPNSQGPNGSHMSILGSTRLSANDMVLVADGVRPGAPGFFYFGATQQQLPLGNGYSCAGTPLLRLASPNLFADANGKLVRPVDFTVGSALNIQPGSVWNFQVKYRDVPGGGARYNFSDGLAITFCP